MTPIGAGTVLCNGLPKHLSRRDRVVDMFGDTPTVSVPSAVGYVAPIPFGIEMCPGYMRSLISTAVVAVPVSVDVTGGDTEVFGVGCTEPERTTRVASTPFGVANVDVRG